MLGSNAFQNINILNKAANASWLRNEVIANNIANVDTPGYKRKDVEFESLLKSAMGGDKSLGGQVANVRLNSLHPRVYTDQATMSYRLDGNNVNIDTESAELAKNQIRYYTLLDSMTQEFSRIRSVLAR